MYLCLIQFVSVCATVFVSSTSSLAVSLSVFPWLCTLCNCIFIGICICIFSGLNIFSCICRCLCVLIFIYICLCIFLFLCTCVSVLVCVSISLHASVLYHSGRLSTSVTQSISIEYSDYIIFMSSAMRILWLF